MFVCTARKTGVGERKVIKYDKVARYFENRTFLTEGSDRSQVIVKALTVLRLSPKTGNFFSSWATVSF